MSIFEIRADNHVFFFSICDNFLEVFIVCLGNFKVYFKNIHFVSVAILTQRSLRHEKFMVWSASGACSATALFKGKACFQILATLQSQNKIPREAKNAKK